MKDFPSEEQSAQAHESVLEAMLGHMLGMGTASDFRLAVLHANQHGLSVTITFRDYPADTPRADRRDILPSPTVTVTDGEFAQIHKGDVEMMLEQFLRMNYAEEFRLGILDAVRSGFTVTITFRDPTTLDPVVSVRAPGQ